MRNFPEQTKVLIKAIVKINLQLTKKKRIRKSIIRMKIMHLNINSGCSKFHSMVDYCQHTHNTSDKNVRLFSCFSFCIQWDEQSLQSWPKIEIHSPDVCPWKYIFRNFAVHFKSFFKGLSACFTKTKIHSKILS